MNKYTKKEIIDAATEAYIETKSFESSAYEFYRNEINPALPTIRTVRSRLGGWCKVKRAVSDNIIADDSLQLKTISVYKLIDAVAEVMKHLDKARITICEYRNVRRNKKPHLPSVPTIKNRQMDFETAKRLAKEKYYEHKSKRKEEEKKKKKFTLKNEHCNNCVWRIDRPNVNMYNCMFRRCVKVQGWFLDKDCQEVVSDEV